MNEWIRPYVHTLAWRVTLIYLPESLSESFRKPVTSSYLVKFPHCAICLQENNTWESAVVSFMVEMFEKCMSGSSSSDRFHTFSFLRARRYSEHYCFSWACSWYQTANVWLDKGCMWCCVCAHVCVCLNFSLCLSFCLLPCELLAVQPSSHSQLWLFPERRAR